MNLSPDATASSQTRAAKTDLKWRLGLLGLAVMAPLLFAPIGPDYYSHRLYQAAWDLGHIPCFALIAYLMRRSLQDRLPLGGLGWILLLSSGALLLGGLVELVQFLIGRSASGKDLFHDWLGAFLVGVLYGPIQRGLSPLLRWSLRGCALVLLGAALAPFAVLAYDYGLAVRQFPLLASFEEASELSRWKGLRHERVPLYPADGQYALRIRFEGEGYEGVSFSHFPGNWQGYQFLELSIYNEGEALKATLRIHDARHVRGEMAYGDRYNRHFVVEPGWNHFRIPLQEVARAPTTRPMEMERIRNLGLFVHNLRRQATIYLDHLRLVAE